MVETVIRYINRILCMDAHCILYRNIPYTYLQIEPRETFYWEAMLSKFCWISQLQRHGDINNNNNNTIFV